MADAPLTTIPAPQPVPVEHARRQWEALRATPALACAPAWSAACQAWWQHDGDHRLRDRALGGLLLGASELAAWRGQHLDQAALIRAHQHVTAMRAGVERDLSRRRLAAGALRSGPVWVDHRGGSRTVFTAADALPAQIARIGAELDQLPAEPMLRAAWISHAITAIHPFGDGNGGTARFLASLELARGWLPPLSLTLAQRRRGYMDGLTEADRSGSLERLLQVVHDVVQQGLAEALLSDGGAPIEWDARSRARAARWVEIVQRLWPARVGDPIAATMQQADDVAATGRRRAVWSCTDPIPTRLELALSPVRGGDSRWMAATVAASAADDGRLSAVHLAEPVAPVLIALDDEPDAVADARFERWVAVRLDQCVRGVAHWM